MLYPNRSGRPEAQARRRLLAVGASILFGVAAFLAFAGALQGAIGVFFGAMALQAALPIAGDAPPLETAT